MFWKHKQPLTIPPCGDIKEHSGYIDEGLGCPNCLSIRLGKKKHDQELLDNQIKEQDMERLAELIATKVAEKLRVPTAIVDSIGIVDRY